MKRCFFLLLILLCVLSNSIGQNNVIIDTEIEVTVHVETPGSLTASIVAEGYTPAQVHKLTVTGILDNTDFSIIKNNMISLRDLNIEGIDNTILPEAAFSGHQNLSHIVLPVNLNSIPNSAFSNCSSLNAIVLPNSITSIGSGAFENCVSLSVITIPNSVENIGESLFSGCSTLSSVCMSDNIASIEASMFKGCSSLTSVIIPDNVKTIGGFAFVDCSSLISLSIPNSVTSIGAWAFSGCTSLSSIVIGTSIESIGWRVFEECNSLTTVYWNSVNCEDFQHDTHFGWKNVSTFVIGEAVEHIPALLCCYLPVTEIIIPSTVTSIGTWAFKGCSSLTNVRIGTGVTSIGSDAFLECSALTSVYWDAINCSDFYYWNEYYQQGLPGWQNVSSFVFGDNVRYIPAYLCYNLPLREISIPNGVDSIGDCAFKGCSSLTSVTTPLSLKRIGNETFMGCDALNFFVIGGGVESIASNAFDNCTSLDTIICLAENPPVVNEQFASIDPAVCKLYVPENTLMDYIYAPVWGAFLNMQGIAVDCTVTLSVGEGGKIFYQGREYVGTSELFVFGGTRLTLQLLPDEGYMVHSVRFNGTEYVSAIDTEGNLVLPFPTADAYIEITFSPAYQIRFLNYDGTELYNDYVECGTIPNYDGVTPTRENTVAYIYTFCGWTPELASVTGDAVYTAKYDSLKRSYLVRFVNYDGIELQKGYVEYGIIPTYEGEIPNKPSTEEVNYQFAGWSPELVNVTAEATYVAVYKTINKPVYTVSFYEYGGSVYFVNDVIRGKTFSCRILAHDGSSIQCVTLNGEDITYLIAENGMLELAEIEENMVLIVYSNVTDIPSNISLSTTNRLRAWQAEGTIFAEVDASVSAVMVYDVAGRLMNEYHHNGNYQVITLPAFNEVNILKMIGKDGNVTAYKLM